MRNVQTKILKCQNVEHRCENCGKELKISEKTESEVARVAAAEPSPSWDG